MGTNYPHLSRIDPFRKNIRGEERVKTLMDRVKYEWDNFNVEYGEDRGSDVCGCSSRITPTEKEGNHEQHRLLQVCDGGSASEPT